MKMKLQDIINENLLENEFQINEKGAGAYKTAKAAGDVEKELLALSRKFGLNPREVKAVYDPIAKTGKSIGQLEKDLSLAIRRDLKSGFKTGGTSAIGTNADIVAKQMTLRQVLDNPNILSKSELTKIKNGVYTKVLTDFKTAEAKLLGKTGAGAGTGAGTGTGTGTGAGMPPKTKSYLSRVFAAKKTAILGLFGTVVTVGGLAYLILNRNHSEDEKPIFDNMARSINGAPPCIQKIIKKYNPNPIVGDDGTIYLSIPNYEGIDGGVIIYMNGTIKQIKTGKMGKWTCKTLQENKKLSLLNIIFEQEQASNEISQQQMSTFVDDAVDDLDGWVAVYNLNSLKNILTSLKGKTYNGKDATQAFFDYYKQDEGVDFASDVNSVGVKTLGVEGMDLKAEILSLISGNSGSNDSTDSDINIVWDGDETPGETTPNPTPQPAKINYHRCQGTYTYGCYNTESIGKIQGCLGLKVDGYFGPLTKEKLDTLGYKNGFTDNDIENICSGQSAPPSNGQPSVTVDKPLVPGQAQVTPSTPSEKQGLEAMDTPRKVYERYFPAMDVPKKGRVRLKIDYISPKDLNNLNAYFSTLKYYLIKEDVKNYGTKYVWKYSDTPPQ